MVDCGFFPVDTVIVDLIWMVCLPRCGWIGPSHTFGLDLITLLRWALYPILLLVTVVCYVT